LAGIKADVDGLKQQQGETSRALPQTIAAALKEEATALQNRWMLTSGSFLVALLGLIISFTSSQNALGFLKANGAWIGIILVLIGIVAVLAALRKPKSKTPLQR
jgi:hypothetical protein